jgi:hypothetical protein
LLWPGTATLRHTEKVKCRNRTGGVVLDWLMRTLKFILRIGCFVTALLPGGLALSAFLNFKWPVDVTGVCLALSLGGLAAGLIYAGWFLLARRNLPISRNARVRLLLFFSGIGIFVVSVVPNFIRTRSTSAANDCIQNLRQIDAAANEFALEHHLTNGSPINFPDDLTPYIRFNSAIRIPPCPEGGIYIIKKVGDTPTCSLGTTVNPPHVLP